MGLQDMHLLGWNRHLSTLLPSVGQIPGTKAQCHHSGKNDHLDWRCSSAIDSLQIPSIISLLKGRLPLETKALHDKYGKIIQLKYSMNGTSDMFRLGRSRFAK
jgi:hypothetical protein